MVHIDIKKLGRIVTVGRRMTGNRTGWEYLHVAVDDRSRPPVAEPPAPSETDRQEAIAYTELLPSEGKDDASTHLTRAAAGFVAHGVTVERVMTDNGSADRSKRFAAALQQHGITHKRTRPYTPCYPRQGRARHPKQHPRAGLRHPVPNLG